MESRVVELRRSQNRVLRWSLGIAVLLHVAVFVLWPSFRIEPLPGWDAEVPAAAQGDGTPIYVQAVFGPPEITGRDGLVHRENRRLEASRVLLLPPECGVLDSVGGPRPHGSLRLRVWQSGRSDVVALAQSTGSECGDEVITAMAEMLWYRWLPDERFPAPVDLVQPVTLVPASK